MTVPENWRELLEEKVNDLLQEKAAYLAASDKVRRLARQEVFRKVNSFFSSPSNFQLQAKNQQELVETICLEVENTIIRMSSQESTFGS